MKYLLEVARSMNKKVRIMTPILREIKDGGEDVYEARVQYLKCY